MNFQKRKCAEGETVGELASGRPHTTRGGESHGQGRAGERKTKGGDIGQLSKDGGAADARNLRKRRLVDGGDLCGKHGTLPKNLQTIKSTRRIPPGQLPAAKKGRGNRIPGRVTKYLAPNPSKGAEPPAATRKCR